MLHQNGLKQSHRRILQLWENGERSPLKIHRITKLSLSTIKYNTRKLRETGSLCHRHGNGRRCRITSGASQAIGQYIKQNKEITAREISTKLRKFKHLRVCERTVQRHLKKIGYTSVRPRKKPMLTDRHRKQRLEWAKAHKNDNWDRTIFQTKRLSSYFAILYVDGRNSLKWR